MFQLTYKLKWNTVGLQMAPHIIPRFGFHMGMGMFFHSVPWSRLESIRKTRQTLENG